MHLNLAPAKQIDKMKIAELRSTLHAIADLFHIGDRTSGIILANVRGGISHERCIRAPGEAVIARAHQLAADDPLRIYVEKDCRAGPPLSMPNKDEWITRCAARFEKQAAMPADQARDCAQTCFEANMEVGMRDYDDDPEGAADEEMSHWAD